jgi:hypothetical protein
LPVRAIAGSAFSVATRLAFEEDELLVLTRPLSTGVAFLLSLPLQLAAVVAIGSLAFGASGSSPLGFFAAASAAALGVILVAGYAIPFAVAFLLSVVFFATSSFGRVCSRELAVLARADELRGVSLTRAAIKEARTL